MGAAYLAFARDHPEQLMLVFGRLAPDLPDWATYVRVAWPFTMVIETCAAGVEAGEFDAQDRFGPAEMACRVYMRGLSAKRA